VDSKGVVGSSPRRSFLAPGIAYLTGLTREAQKHESGGIESEGISWVDLGGLGSESGDSENLGFHLNSHVLTFRLKCYGVANGRTFMNLGVRQNVGFVMCVDYMHVSEVVILLTYAVISFLRSLPGYRARAYLQPLASNALLVPSDSLSCSARHRARWPAA